jgi:O-antigen/teichoic acid export membrane protein
VDERAASDATPTTPAQPSERQRLFTRLGRSLRSGGMVRGTVVLGGGTAIAQLFTVVAAPFITRLYSPFELGQFGLVVAFLNIVAATLTLRLEMAIVSCPTREEAARVALLAMLIVPFSTVGATAVLFALTVVPVGPYAEIPVAWTLLVPVPLAAIGVVSVLRYWVVRKEDFVPLSQLAVIQSAARGISVIGLGFLQAGALGLFIGDLLGRIAGTTRLLMRELPGILASAGRPAWAGSRTLLSRYWKFPVLSLPSSFVNTLAGALALPLIGHYYGLEAAGYYALVQTVFALPMTVVARSVADVFHGSVATLARDAPDRVASLFLRTAGALGGIGIPIGAMAIVLGPALFPLVFGDQWRTAGYVAAALAPRMVGHMIVSPLSRIVFVYEGQEAKLIFDGALLTLTIAALTGSKLLGLTFLAALAILALADLIAYGLYAGILWRLIRRSTPVEAAL